MSIICQTFVQNAWRSDLCSNCFKSLDDHSGVRNDRMSTPRYVPQAPSLYQSRGISTTLKWRLSEPLYERVALRDFASQTPPKSDQTKKEERGGKGILVKDTERRLRSRSSVDFASEEALVIGYGGNDYDSDLSPWEMGSDDGSIDFDLLDDTDEDRKITKLTKNNTEFNSSNQNLLPDSNTLDRSKKEDQKYNTVNNNNQVTKSRDKPLNILNCVTYNNDIQAKTEKKLNQYYFPSSTELNTSYLHKNGSHTVNIGDNLLKNNKERSKLSGNNKVENSTKKEIKISEENCRNLLKNDFTPLNTRTYSFVSELNRSNMCSDHSSDSDYSTCRHTPGDSTDSESFQDAEDHARIEPVSSFLHGNYPKNLSPSAILELECDKKYDGGSSTSGDISNLSDDSDAHDMSEVVAYKSKIVRNSKLTENKKIMTKQAVESPLPPEVQKHTEEKKVQNQSTSVKSGITTIQLKSVSNDVKTSTVDKIEREKLVGTSRDGVTVKKRSDVVSISVDSPFKTSVHGIDSNCHRIASTTDCKLGSENAVSSDLHKTATFNSNSKENQAIQIKTATTDLQTPTKGGEETSKDSHKDPPKHLRNLKSQESVENNAGNSKQQISTPITKDLSDDNEEGIDCEASPDTIAHRQSKLAALALELELARRDSPRPNSINIPPTVQNLPPQVKSPSTPIATSSPEQLYPTIRKSGSVSCSSRLVPLPDVLQETPTKSKKSRFSLKKLLKRNKDNISFSASSKENNPKAWKKQSFDRSRLSLEIVHPMDLTNDSITSGESSPVDDNYRGISNHPAKGLFKGGYSRTKSLSALPQVSLDSPEQGNCSLIDCRKVETLPSRKAGTVAERKKSRPSLVRTPSCSALPNRSQPTTPSPENNDRAPPPKPPPPPKYKAMQPPPPPPPPPHHLRSLKNSSNSPARPPPPKIPEGKFRGQSNIPEGREHSNFDKEYANLGDIRSQLIPKKPQRPSAVSTPRDSETEQKRKNFDDLYETLQAAEEEEDHYTYLDESEVKTNKGNDTIENEPVSRFKTNSDSSACGRPWLDLQTSYSAIAATNYESLAEIITTAMNESPEYLRKAGKSLKFKDFILESETPEVVLRNRLIYNGEYKNQEQDKVTLMVIPRQQNTPPPRNQTRYPVLATFNDHVPKHQKSSSNKEMQFASVYVLQSSRISTILQFSRSASVEKSNQHVHLQNYCFILLQLIHTLKSLQAEGIEEVHFDLDQLILVATHEDKPPIFVLFPEDKNLLTFCDTAQGRKTLCQATLVTMYHFLNIKKSEELKNCLVNGEHLAEPIAHTFKAIAKVLMEEKASSLSQAKGFLEYMLWGPVDVKVSDSEPEDVADTILQRWLDLQRAQMVKSTISQLQPRSSCQTNIHIFEEYQLIFLLQASVKSLKSVISKL